MELFLFHFRQTGNTVEQCFIGDIAFGTIDLPTLKLCYQLNPKTSVLVDGEISLFPDLVMASSHKRVQHGSIPGRCYEHHFSTNITKI